MPTTHSSHQFHDHVDVHELETQKRLHSPLRTPRGLLQFQTAPPHFRQIQLRLAIPKFYTKITEFLSGHPQTIELPREP